MKKLYALLLVLLLAASLLSAFPCLSVSADDALEGELWSPTEILLTSTVAYENPYMDATIDATFTHEDGTTMTTPGFWKEGKKWAVRFSPTKLGRWTYKITCSDAGNEGLNVTGTLLAKETAKTTDLAKHGFVRVADNHHTFCYDDGTPFFWLGDTHWQAPNYESTSECNYPGCYCGSQFRHEIDNRAEKGFTVYQTYFDTAESDGGGQKGKQPSLWEEKFTKPAVDQFNKKVDKMFEYLHENGFVIALGFGVHVGTMNSIREDDFLRFVRYAVARYNCYSIVYISGQEITDESPSLTKGKSAMDVYMAGSALVAQLDPYHHPGGAHMYNLKALDPRCIKLDKAEWHTWWTVQTGHARVIQDKEYYEGFYNSLSKKIKPFVETECNYEDLNAWIFNGYDAARISAWNAVLNGSAGYTYGAVGIWANCFSNENNTGWYGPESYSLEPWYMGLDKPGSFEMTYLRRFFEKIPGWESLIPRFKDESWGDFLKEKKKLVTAAEDKSTFVAYFATEDSTTGTLKNLDAAKTYRVWWYDTQTGKYIPVTEGLTGVTEYAVPERPTVKDWVLLVTDRDLGTLPTEKAYVSAYADGSTNALTGTAVKPKKVTAIGGLKYKSGRVQDQTKALYDLDGTTVWQPLADRPSQTILYDLGGCFDLTNVVITPATGTTIPDYRIDASNDGKSWTILTDTTLQAQAMMDDGLSRCEKVNGAYRYVKILLLNAKDLQKDDPAREKYAMTYSEYYKCWCSHTALSEITVFASGQVEAPAEETPAPLSPEETPAPKDTQALDARSWLLWLGGGLLGAILGAAIVLIAKKKKQKDA